MHRCTGFISIPYHDIMKKDTGCRGTVHGRAILPAPVFSSSFNWVLTLQENYYSHEPPLFPMWSPILGDRVEGILGSSSMVIAFLSLLFELLTVSIFHIIILYSFTFIVNLLSLLILIGSFFSPSPWKMGERNSLSLLHLKVWQQPLSLATVLCIQEELVRKLSQLQRMPLYMRQIRPIVKGSQLLSLSSTILTSFLVGIWWVWGPILYPSLSIGSSQLNGCLSSMDLTTAISFVPCQILGLLVMDEENWEIWHGERLGLCQSRVLVVAIGPSGTFWVLALHMPWFPYGVVTNCSSSISCFLQICSPNCISDIKKCCAETSACHASPAAQKLWTAAQMIPGSGSTRTPTLVSSSHLWCWSCLNQFSVSSPRALFWDPPPPLLLAASSAARECQSPRGPTMSPQ